MCKHLDRVLLELNLPPEECYTNLDRVIEGVNVLINTYADTGFSEFYGGVEIILVDPCKGTVAFCSGLSTSGVSPSSTPPRCTPPSSASRRRPCARG